MNKLPQSNNKYASMLQLGQKEEQRLFIAICRNKNIKIQTEKNL